MKKQNGYVTKIHFDQVIGKVDEKLDKMSEQLDWFIGKYQAHDEEHALLNGRVSDHSDRLEVVEEKLGIVA